MRLNLSIILMALAATCFGQGWVTNGAHVVMKDDVNIVVTTAAGNYLNKSNGLLLASNGGNITIRGNWINNGTTPAIGNNDGTVILDGGAQQIAGSTPTSFNNLYLRGADKTLQLTATVGGGYAGSKSGQLDLGAVNLLMQQRRLIVNNPSNNAIKTATGLLIGETNSAIGYSEVQWNLRGVSAGQVFTIPYGTSDLISIPLSVVVGQAGTQSADSGFVRVSTFPTATTSVPNNRPLPTGVANLDNKYLIENDIKTVDRYYVLTTGGYSNEPKASLELPYVDREWDLTGGSINEIIENDLKPARYNLASNAWNYDLDGTTSVSGNFNTTDEVADLNGVWVLHNIPPCPVAHFNVEDECLDIAVQAIDSSFIIGGTIDTTVWVTESQAFEDMAVLTHKYPSAGVFDIQRKVRGKRGCWDSVSYQVELFPLPQSNFQYIDTCFNDLTQFASNSSSPAGLPITENWLIDGTTYTDNTVYHTYADTGSKPVRLIAENAFGCLDTIGTTITIEPAPEVQFSFEDICEEVEAQFVNSSVSKGIITGQDWQIDNIATSVGWDYNQVFNRRGTYDIKLIVSNGYGCVDSLTQVIVVKPKAVANFSVFPNEIFITDPYVNFVEQTTFATTWEWELGDMSDTEYGPDVFHVYGDTGVFSIRLIAGNDQNCPDTIFKTIRIKPYLRVYIPNAFRPDGTEELNSRFGPAGMLYGLKEMSMEIYNRWGEQLYFTEDINQPWDGTYLGEPVQEGSYLYVIRMKDIYNQIAWHKGVVTLVR